jgi:uncharacterized protein with NRDE domain
MAPLDYLASVAERGLAYNGFNLIVGDFGRRELAWYCNRGDAPPTLLSAGTHGISNAVLDTPWPKLVRKRAELAALVAQSEPAPLGTLIELMRDNRIAPDNELPATGISLVRERALSAAFIETADYGTRGTTALGVQIEGARHVVDIAERSDDDESHRVVRPGNIERRYSFEFPTR